jgi:hypothetical protein
VNIRGVSFHAWKLFSKCLLHDEDEKTLGLYRHREHICKPSYDLPTYTQPLLSPNVDFITHLVISGGCDFATNELLCLANMPNLGVLEVIQPADELRMAFPTVSNGLVRGWAEMENPFPLLRVLRVWGDESTTQDSLVSVAKFPSLALYDVMGLREDWSKPYEHASRTGWELAEPVTRMEDSLLRYLLLFASGEEALANGQRDMAKGIDSDLVSLCADSRCAVRFVDYGQAPALLDYLNDSAKLHAPAWDMEAASREGRSCHEKTFEAWAFWLYAFIGQLTGDRDMAAPRSAAGQQPDTQAVVGPFVLPSKPMACLFLGHSGRGGIATKPSYVSRGLFVTKRFTFIRRSVINGAEPAYQQPSSKVADTESKAKPPDSSGGGVRRQKRRRIDEMLDSFTG